MPYTLSTVREARECAQRRDIAWLGLSMLFPLTKAQPIRHFLIPCLTCHFYHWDAPIYTPSILSCAQNDTEGAIKVVRSQSLDQTVLTFASASHPYIIYWNFVVFLMTYCYSNDIQIVGVKYVWPFRVRSANVTHGSELLEGKGFLITRVLSNLFRW